ncbi:hypothetical protein FEP82_03721 [Burkholderia multivorans]|nr:hypothetical protein [Burkholderia multivorans]
MWARASMPFTTCSTGTAGSERGRAQPGFDRYSSGPLSASSSLRTGAGTP